MKRVFIFVCGLFVVLPNVTYAVPLTAEHLYTFARQKNEKLLDKYSKHIDITNKNNDTALCISVKQRDRDSFELLKDYGASTKVDCLQKMLKKSVVKQDNAGAVVSDSDGEFLGMGLKGWGLTGLAVAGIAVASGGGGGGRGSSSGSNIIEDEESVVLNCINGIQVGDACQCNAGYIGELCENKAECNGYYQTCPDGYEKGNNTCQSGEDLLYKCDIEIECSYTTTSCQDGYHETGNTCKSGETTYVECDVDECIGFDYTSCSTGYSASATCKSGETFKYQCDNCAEGYSKDASGNCIRVKEADVIGSTNTSNNSEINIENTEYRDVYGMHNITDGIINSSANKTTPHARGGIMLKNYNDGNIYGIYAKGVIYNSYMHLYGTDGSSVGSIDITNVGNGNVYGIYSLNGSFYNVSSSGETYGATEIIKSKSSININNIGDGYIYGMYGSGGKNSAGGGHIRGIYYENEAEVSINNIGNGYVYGLYGINTVYNSTSNIGIINITNKGNGNIYGLYSKNGTAYNSESNAAAFDEDIFVQSTINIENEGDGSVFGIYAPVIAYNSVSANHNYGKGKGVVDIINKGNGTAYGIYSLEEAHNVYGGTGLVNIKNIGNGTAYGIYSLKTAYNAKGYYLQSHSIGEINIENDNNGNVVGMYGKNVYNISNELFDTQLGTNESNINISNKAEGSAVGMCVTGGEAINSGNITIEGGKLAIGIYGESGSNITNSGTITISGADTSYGIYAEDETVTVSNTGKISIDGNYNHDNKIKLNGGKLFQDGELVAQNLALNDFGGEVIASSNSKFVAEDKIYGDLSVSADVVQNGFDKTYISKDVISAKDVDGLNLSSKSALFDAKLENDSDIVMDMKEFGDVVEDKSVAGFLSDNYSNQNNEKLFNNLKGIENAKSLNSALNDMTGKDMFNRLAFEYLTMAREFNFDLNNKLFNNKEENLTTSGSISPWMFSGASNSQTRYSLNNMTIGNNTVGLAVALTDVNTNDGNGKNARNDKMYQMAMPVGYSAYGFDFITTPSVGYSYGTYNRLGYNNTNYKGTLEKQTFGLMNEARYPFMMAGWNLNLALEFNVMGYRVSGDEGSKEFGLNIAEQDSFSVEAGFGMYANKDIDISKDSKLKLYNGVAFYKEFADPYKMKVGMNGMSGTYTLRDNDRSKNRAVVRTGFDYTSQDLSLYGSLSSYIDHELQTNADIGLKYNF